MQREEGGLCANQEYCFLLINSLFRFIPCVQLCYRIQPSRLVGRHLQKSLGGGHSQVKMQQAYTAAMQQATTTVRKLSWLRNNSAIEPARLTTSLAESLCFRAAAKPGTFIFKLWASYQIVRIGKQRVCSKKKHEERQNSSGKR